MSLVYGNPLAIRHTTMNENGKTLLLFSGFMLLIVGNCGHLLYGLGTFRGSLESWPTTMAEGAGSGSVNHDNSNSRMLL